MRFLYAPVLLLLLFLGISGCKKDKFKECIIAKVIYLGGPAPDPCMSPVAVLMQDVDEIPKGTNISLIEHNTPLELKLNQVIHFKLNVRAQQIPIPFCDLNPKYMFQIDVCK